MRRVLHDKVEGFVKRKTPGRYVSTALLARCRLSWRELQQALSTHRQQAADRYDETSGHNDDEE